MVTELGTEARDPGPLFTIAIGDPSVPTLAVALHDGAALRPEVAARLALDPADRRREEDPGSATWTAISPNRVVVRRSRFEVDLNRPPERAVYTTPEEAWGRPLWRIAPDAGQLAGARAAHARFYATVGDALDRLLRRHRRVLVFDLHSYNHRRAGADAPPADPTENPELNVGTGSMDRARWSPVVDAFLDAAARCRIDDHRVDARENVRFFGGFFPTWVHRQYPERACALALEVKKTFMDEWTGELDAGRLWAWREVLRAGAEAARAALERA